MEVQEAITQAQSVEVNHKVRKPAIGPISR